jgi:signal transduction histidine kinase
MQPSSINLRLWLTYSLIILLVLFFALAGIVFAFQSSPLLYRQVFLRMDLVSHLLTNRLSFVIAADWDPTIDLFFKEAELLDVEVAIIDNKGASVFLSDGYLESELPPMTTLAQDAENSQEHILTFRDEEKIIWFYKISKINDNYYLLVAAERPNVAIGSLFQDELVKPMLKTGLFALIGAFVVSWLMAEWITRPLKRLSQSANNIAEGKYDPIPIEGPREVQQLARSMNDMSGKVENSLKSQRDFVANVSHEFKTPLTSIQGFSQAIFDETVHKPADIKHAAEVILKETDRLNILVNDLLTLAKLDAGTMAMNKEKIEINHLIKSLIEDFRFEIEKSGVRIKGVYTKPLYLFADSTRLSQVFLNLIDNAIKFSKSGSQILITISREGNYACVGVKDQGAGISEEELERIFERFYQVDKARKGGSDHGVGLGLAIARQIVVAHGGEISATSQLGEGSTFMVKLPIEDATQNQ